MADILTICYDPVLDDATGKYTPRTCSKETRVFKTSRLIRVLLLKN